jgi:hypothetical protein
MICEASSFLPVFTFLLRCSRNEERLLIHPKNTRHLTFIVGSPVFEPIPYRQDIVLKLRATRHRSTDLVLATRSTRVDAA